MESMQELGISCTPISFGDYKSEASIADAVRELQETGIKVSVVVTYERSLPLFARVANEELKQDYDSHVWILGDLGMATALASNEDVYASDPASKHLMEGFLSASAAMKSDSLKPLADSVKEFHGVFAKQVARGAYWRSGLDPTQVYPDIPDPEHQDSRDMLLKIIMGSLVSNHDVFSLSNYDAVWALAAGLGAALKRSSGDTSDLAAKVIQTIQDGAVPMFDGLSGFQSWDANGDVYATNQQVTIHSFSQYLNGGAATVAEVARWDNASGIKLSEVHPVVWRDGRQYPQVPSDGSKAFHPWLVPSAVAIAVVATVLVLSLVYVLHRNNHLESRLGVLMGTGAAIDLDSPVKKILDFLGLCNEAPFWKLPSRQAASKLQDLILMNAGHLTEPTLDGSEGGWLDGQLRWFMTAQPAYARPVSGSVSQQPSRQPSYSATEPLPLAAPQQVPTPLDSVVPAPTVVPPEVREGIGSDFFLDLVTDSSALRQRCISPLAAVAHVTWEKLLAGHFTKRNLDSTEALTRLSSYAARIEMGYDDNMYHCKLHAADVTNRMVAIMVHSGLFDAPIRSRLPLGLVALVAAAVHDYNHPQRNNHLLIAKGHDSAEEFNDQAPAENHSLREALRLLSEPQFNFLESLGIAQRRDDIQLFRSLVIDTVLGTEMARHFDLLGQFDAQVASNQHLSGLKPSQIWTAMNQNQRTLTLQVAMKVADIGHCSAQLDQHKLWCQRLQEEFFAQGDEEKELGLHVSAMMDRKKPGVLDPSSQVGFFRIIAIPLFTSWVKAFPNCNPILEQAIRNMEYWASFADAGVSKETQTV